MILPNLYNHEPNKYKLYENLLRADIRAQLGLRIS
jgi:hypothetical protein